MKLITEEWKFHSKLIPLFLGVWLIVPLGVLWFVSLGHVRLVAAWWKFLCKQQYEMER